MSNSKAELRAKALAARDALSEKKRTAAAAKLAKRGLPFPLLPGSIVSGYSPIRSEIDPLPLMKALAEAGARLALPCVTARGQSLIFRIFHPNDRLMLGPLGIPEPSPAAAEVIPDIMLTPLAPSTVSAIASAMARGTTTTPSRICARPSRSSASGLLLQRRRSRRFRHYRTTSRWIMC